MRIVARTTDDGSSSPLPLSRSAEQVLGPDHPISRASHWHAVLVQQAALAGSLFPLAIGLAALKRSPETIAFASCAVVVEIAVVAATVLAATVLRERARDSIAADGGRRDVDEIRTEYLRLEHSTTRDLLAHGLQRTLHEAEHWHEIPISTRPPPAVCQLLAYEDVVTAIAGLVREPGADVRGVALLDRLLGGGFSSLLYRGPSQALEEELRRIRYLLS